jgi:hypothetical protein
VISLGFGGGYAPIPERHDQLGHLAKRVPELPGKAEIRDFDATAIVHKQVGCFEVTMELGW